ncbi:MsnO8 family LLM class oxidoreductase [Mycolicibacter senuensis]|uniref:Alkanal monooxygenase subunit alpha n=1 Tax=Mycolicibacter senuensis TaxID=386913 RepID=A0A7I9XFA8_9MYCO|nr:MsnO8 family LLM class oxidoreductase [Mycolicibacter senuensis]MDQ2625390.1 MsnO8 family LLM class oxidoreductase [Actinomycetota bacterium]ORW66611.1 luciferase [Mycolicibacter senuensis]GFG68639.1 alkanal monooxygenase subunit alpha [Mycolicibacter senuensis]
MRLSVLDLAPVRTDQSSPDALAATIRLAKLADSLDYTRYWAAEHHNLPSVAATNPAVLVAMLAAATSRLQVGAGGVMLPNHAPLAVAEQFALLEAAHPGRIDLGIGRAPGADPVASTVLRSGRDDSVVDQFPDHLDDVIALLGPAGVSVQLTDRNYVLKSTPRALTTPRVFVLGSSVHSAGVAAAKGLPYVFGHHLFGEQTAEALAYYRSEFVPSELATEPTVFLTVNTVVAETHQEATALILPYLHMQARTSTGHPPAPVPLVEEAQQTPLTPEQHRIAQAELARAVVGTPAEALAQLRELAARFGVDELMLNPVASARQGADPAASPGRESTLELVAGALPHKVNEK